MLSKGILVTVVICCFCFPFLAKRWWLRKKAGDGGQPTPPEPAGSLPILGHLRVLGGPEPPHRALAKLADKYGPIMMMRLGVRRLLVISNSKMAKECLLTNDKDFVTRPRILAIELLSYNYSLFGLSPFGQYWREVRKVSTLELLSNQRLESLKHVKVLEVRAAIKDLYDKCCVNKEIAVEMREWFGNVAMNNILQLIVGKPVRKHTDKTKVERCLGAFREFFKLIGVLAISDAVPSLRWLDIGGFQKLMKKNAEELDVFAQEWLESHRRDREVHGAGIKRDFMDVLIDIFDAKDAKTFGYTPDAIIKSTCLTMALGGTDTTSVTLTWALSLLLNNPETLKKVQQELDIQVGREKCIEESDINKLVYLQAVIKETLRLFPALPLSVARESINNVVLDGYHIPSGTLLLVNIHKIHRDPTVWGDDASAFKPERFLTTHAHIDLLKFGVQFDLIPFSSGRRVCPGASYALQAVSFTLALLLHSFEVATRSTQPVDMTETSGLTNLKATPLEVILTPRLPSHLYDFDG